MSTVTERVAAGAAFLDEHDPEWWRADVRQPISLRRLDLGDPAICVLGQRCPLEVLTAYLGIAANDLNVIDFGDGYQAYAEHLASLSGDDLSYWASDHGFTLTTRTDDELLDWESLTAEWKRIITGRRPAS